MNEVRSVIEGVGLPAPGEIAEIARLAETEAGLVISPDKVSMVQSRLAKRLRRLNLGSWRAYLDHVSGASGTAERAEMVSALTTNVSHFFRESHHFDTLRSDVLPPLIARARRGGRVRIWSAGCSQGQEAYSIAMTLLDMMPDAERHDFRILATDIDRAILDRARVATYDDSALAAIPAGLAGRFVVPASGGGTIAAAPRALVRFRDLNLHADWPMQGQFDVIFCRNVVIYFAPERQQRLWSRFAAALAQGGWLFVGHSERVPVADGSPFETAGITTYRRKAS